MDKLREENRKQFEKFYREEYLRGEDSLTRSPVTGTYIYAHAQGHWKSWIRSRQSIVVELPDNKPHTDGPLADGWNACHSAMKQIIRSIGLSIKGE
ncbi:hypothetical protein [Serratia ficaria]|uniref:hypothetical protein n=1 Tax=Serratia ficaria TaxID=61651 RepID=UPI0012ED0E6F|nr:hypothetical protein [Serratia ficaria]